MPDSGKSGWPPQRANVTLVNQMGKAYADALRRIERSPLRFFLTPARSAGIFELQSISRSRLATWEKRNLFPFRAKKGDCSSRTHPRYLDISSDKCWEIARRNTDGDRTHSSDEPGAFECDAPLDGLQGDRDPPPPPLCRRPSHSILGDGSSSSDSSWVMSKVPTLAGMLQLIGLLPRSLPWVILFL